jgi:hypothetical protein
MVQALWLLVPIQLQTVISCDSFAELRSFHSGSLKTCCITMLAYNQIASKGISINS